ncbi:hypothetical protein HGO34_02315 [Agrobacterium vitis]|uniref:hypothetical protein n=1 Tax=Rhizobium/Agrobacterium group TaxID=227290 RepID=UPI001F1A15F2|nr:MULTISPECIES: hypothetical protein [Rhizobium/Agrobacterium group]MCF1501662.1 hypothetical protein [Allorhizobium sp. Av2]MCM2438552.1 hypothetical protein [Agrobacterium vitis]MCM2473111.1 hypothetical protein [Rhizobium sp. CG5]
MCAQHSRARRGRPRRPVPQALPDDLYDYGDDTTPPPAPRRRNLSPDTFDVEKLPVIDDWPERVPVTEAEVDIFERYFGDVLDRLFGPLDVPPDSGDLHQLSSDDNSKP